MIENMLVLSTAHLTPATCEYWMKSTPAPLAAYEKGDYGWFVYVAEETGDEVPADLRECLALARKCKAEWIMFDRDAAAIVNLPTYDWGS